MRPNLTAIVALLGGALLGALLVSLQRADHPSDGRASEPVAASDAPSVIDTSSKTIAELRTRIAALEAGQRRAEAAAAPSEPLEPRPRPPTNFEEALAKASAEDAQVAERLERTLASEARDARWADTFEPALMKVLEAETFAGSHIKALKCGASLCRLEVQHDDEASLGAFESDFAMAAPPNQGGFMRRVETEPGHYESEAYIARPGSHVLRHRATETPAL